jgi:hypothetical protein
MTVILAAISKMATKMRKISKYSNFNENWYVGFFPHEECDSDKSDLNIKMLYRLWTKYTLFSYNFFVHAKI